MKRIINFDIFNESVKDKMTGKSDRLEEWTRQDPSEVIRRFTDAFPKIRMNEIRIYREQFLLGIVIEKVDISEYDKIREWFDKNTIYTVYSFKKRRDNCLFLDIDKKSPSKTNESIRDMMTPKSSEDIINTFENSDGLEKKKMFIKLIRDRFKYTSDFYDFTEFTLGISDWRRITKGIPANNRDFYELIDRLKKHELNKLFKALIIKESLNEGIRDKMKPKTDDEIIKMCKHLNPNSRLLKGCNEGILCLVKNAIDDGADVNFCDSKIHDSMTPLFFAITSESHDIIKYLLSKGATINKFIENYVYDRGLYKIRILLDEYRRNPEESTHMTYYEYRPKDINEGIRDKMIPKSDDDIKRSLSDVTEERIYDMYIKAIIESDFTALDILKKNDCDINSRNKEKQTPLMFACEYEYSQGPMIKALVTKLGANMNLKDRNNRTALMYAVDNDNLGVVKMLLTLGVDLKKFDQGARALIRAVTVIKDYNIVLALVNAGADINYIDNNHSTALIYSTLISQRQVTRLLLSKGADVNIQNENGMSPLMMAARGNDQEIIRMLLDAGADINLKNNNHQTAADFAIAYTKKDNADLIRNYKKINESKNTTDPKIGKSFWFEYHCLESPSSADAEVWYHSHQRVKVLSRGKDDHDEFPDEPKTYIVQFEDGLEWDVFDDELMDSKDEFYRPDPPLKESIRDKMTPKSKEDILKSFRNLDPDELFRMGDQEDYDDFMIEAIERGYGLEANNKEGIKTIIRQNHVKVVEYLLKKGYDLKTEKGFDPFYIAALNGHNKMIRLMIKYGVELIGTNSISAAITMGHKETLHILTDYYQKTRSIHESLRDKMTPKSKKEIDNELEEMEPFERLMTIFNYQMEVPYYTQDQIDRMAVDFISIANDIFDLDDKIECLYEYFELSVLIREELKSDLKTLPASEQILYVHDMEKLRKLYTDQEWSELEKRSKTI